MNAMITITPAATTYIKAQLEKNSGLGFRISIKKTGCSGYSYLPAIIHSVNSADQCIEIESGLKIFIDTTWLHLLQDLQIDYLEEDKSGLKQKRLVFTNPNESSRCGCGESFHVE